LHSGHTIITSQFPVDRWYEIIGNPTIADAVLDRLVHNAYCIELTGESMRKRKQETPAEALAMTIRTNHDIQTKRTGANSRPGRRIIGIPPG
jgi:hypothetical protein